MKSWHQLASTDSQLYQLFSSGLNYSALYRHRQENANYFYTVNVSKKFTFSCRYLYAVFTKYSSNKSKFPIFLQYTVLLNDRLIAQQCSKFWKPPLRKFCVKSIYALRSHCMYWENYGNLLSRIFHKNFVKATFLLKKLVKNWFHGEKNSVRDNFAFFHTALWRYM